LHQEHNPKLLETRTKWEEAREAARSSRDRRAVRELGKARKNLRKAMRQLEEAARNANSTADPELRKKEIEAYEHLLKIERDSKTDAAR
jgi:Sec-independent protein translocase protein TatA